MDWHMGTYRVFDVSILIGYTQQPNLYINIYYIGSTKDNVGTQYYNILSIELIHIIIYR